jgi:hypothetical protein
MISTAYNNVAAAQTTMAQLSNMHGLESERGSATAAQTTMAELPAESELLL